MISLDVKSDHLISLMVNCDQMISRFKSHNSTVDKLMKNTFFKLVLDIKFSMFASLLFFNFFEKEVLSP